MPPLPKTPSWFKPEITISGAIQIVLLLAAIAGSYYGIIGRVNGSEQAIADIKAQVASITSLATRVTVLETTTAAGRANRDKQISDINIRVDQNQSALEAKLDKVVDGMTALSNQVASLTATIKATEDRRP